MRTLKALILVFGMVPFIPSGDLAGQEPDPVVHAVLFYNRGCPHCAQLITEHLIPLQNQYGDRLVLVAMDTALQWANNLYWEAIRHYEIPEDDWVVPIMIVADQVMVGGNTIPARLPGMIENGLASGGIDLPDFPALLTFLRQQNALDPRYPDRRIVRRPASPEAGTEAAAPDAEVLDEAAPGREETGNPSEVDSDAGRGGGSGETSAAQTDSQAGEQPAESDPESLSGSTGSGVGPMDLQGAAREMESMSMGDRFNMDRAGNSVSVLALVVMLVVLALRGYPPRVPARRGFDWIVPVLVAAGAGVATYLSVIEVTNAEAVCGPVGDCNTVNQSEYASLFGVLPVGLLGLIGYALLFFLWVVRRVASGSAHRWATLGLWAGALMGTLFSVYLTFLEPFVIGATCVWCLTSAMVMTLLLWQTSSRASAVWNSPGDQGPPG